MMSGITFMTAYVNSTINKNINVGIDLNHALKITLIPIVSTPWFIGYKFKPEIFRMR